MRRLILGFAIVAPLLAIGAWQRSPAGAIGVLALSHALLLYPTLRPNVQWLGPVITCFDSGNRRELWLTIDDGPTKDTPAILDLLGRLETKATFFLKGELVLRDPGLVRQILERGHSVANHSNSHPSATFWSLGPRRIAREIDLCNTALADATGSAPRLFRAPVGMKNPWVHPHLRRRGMQLIGWSARGFDATMKDPDGVLTRLRPNVRPGAIIVLHQGRSWSLEVIERVVTELQREGYSFVIPDEGRLKTKR